MLQKETKVTIADNSGGKIGKVVGVRGKSNASFASIGDIVVVSIQQAIPRAAIKKHQVERAVVVRTKKEVGRKDGSYIRFDENAVVLIDPTKKTPKGTRIFGPVARELKERGFDKIISLAPEVL
jgi:large subunit ribosomal protein L14